MTVVAGVILETAPGAELRVAARLVTEPGLELTGSDGDRRIAAVWTGPSGRALEEMGERLLARDPDVLGIFPTFVGTDDDEAP